MCQRLQLREDLLTKPLEGNVSRPNGSDQKKICYYSAITETGENHSEGSHLPVIQKGSW